VVTGRPGRIVDAHVHLWDPARTDWYPYLAGGRSLGLGDVSGMARRFDVPTYRAESAGWNVERLVNVAAATGPHSIDETLEVGRRAEVDGQPAAIVGGLPPTASVAEAIEVIERQMATPRFRGVRPMGVGEGPVPAPEVLRALAERDLMFEVLARPDRLLDAAAALDGFDGLTVVVEHVGWPRTDTDEERALCRVGLEALAGLGPQVVCKLSGLAAAVGAIDAAAFRPWLEPAIEAFGPERCLFASNFPVDGLHGTLDDLFTAYSDVTAGLDEGARDNLFAATAERVYGLGPME